VTERRHGRRGRPSRDPAARCRALLAPAVAALACAGTATAQIVESGYEPPPRVRAADVVSESQLRSGAHLVRGEVRTEGNSFHFRLESEYGTFTPGSLAMLELRVQEIRTLDQAINQYRQRDREFASELRGQLAVGADSFVDILSSPLDTASQLGEQLVTNARDTLTAVSELDFSTPREPGTAEAGGAGAVVEGHRRSIASQLRLDPYSTNPKVQEFLGMVARARTSGQFTAGVATITVPQPRRRQVAGGALDLELASRVSRNSAAELHAQVARQLAALGVGEDALAGFLQHRAFSPRHRAAIAAHLDYVRPAENLGAMIEAALGALDEEDALSFERMARMLAVYHEQVEPISSLRTDGPLPVAQSSAGALVAVLPVDTIYWNREADRIFAALAQHAYEHGFERRVLVVSGRVSDAARARLGGLGFEVRERFLNPS